LSSWLRVRLRLKLRLRLRLRLRLKLRLRLRLRLKLRLRLRLRRRRRLRLRLRLRVEAGAKAEAAYLVEAVPPDDEAEEDALQRGGLAHVRAADPLARLRRPLVADHAEHLGCHATEYVQRARGWYRA
jgi:hypothetical protein